MKKQLLTLFSVTFLASQLMMGQRFLTNVYNSYTKTADVTYANNVSVLTGTLTSIPLNMDIYEPAADTMAKRPAVIVLHTGSFLPAVANGQPTGSKTDSAVVELCKRLSGMGYVACAATYRMGWNPLASDQDTRTATLLQAVYRAIQDAKSAVRFLKKDAATTDTYGIDSTRIAIVGLGTGGYISYAYASLNKYSEITLSKFINVTQNQPYIDTALYGNFDGTLTRTFCTATNLGHSSSIRLAAAVGGAAGDSSWMEAGEVPFVGMQCTMDPNAPYNFGAVIVPTTGNFVVNASGSGQMIPRANRINNNAVFAGVPINAYVTKANSMNNGANGLYPFKTPAPSTTPTVCGLEKEQGSPWDWWDEATFVAMYNAYSGTTNGAAANCLQKLSNPDMSAAQGKAYADTIAGYLAPHMVQAMALPGNTLSIEDAQLSNSVMMYPNPAGQDVTILLNNNLVIENVIVMDITGKVVEATAQINTNAYIINHASVKPGMYIVKVQLKGGKEVNKKLIVE